MLHQNIQGLKNKLLDLEVELISVSPEVLCFSESWLKLTETEGLNLSNYTFASSYSRLETIRGGVAILVKDQIQFKKLPVEHLCIEREFECTCVRLTSYYKCIIAVIYRPPNSNFKVFIQQLNQLLDYISAFGQPAYICGDINVNFLIVSATQRNN